MSEQLPVPTMDAMDDVQELPRGGITAEEYTARASKFAGALPIAQQQISAAMTYMQQKSDNFYVDVQSWLTTTDATVTINGQQIQSFKALQNEFTDPASHPTHAQLATALAGYASASAIDTAVSEAINGLTQTFDDIDTAISLKQPKRDVTYLSTSQHNNIMMVMNGRLFTTSGNSASNANSGTGRGGDNNVTQHSLEKFTEVNFPNLPEAANLIKVGGDGYSFNFALFDNGYLYVWGQNIKGVCGVGHTSPIPFPVLALTDCVEVYHYPNATATYAIGQPVALVKRTDGYIYGAGDGDDGQFGIGNTSNQPAFIRLDWMGQNPKYVKASNGYGGQIICQKADGEIWIAGNGLNGALFNGSTSNEPTAISIGALIGGANAGDIIYWHHAYAYHSGTSVVQHSYSLIARRDSAGNVRVFTVGNGTWGQIGNGATQSPTTPYEVMSLPDQIIYIDVIGGGVPTIRALASNGDLYMWGHGNRGLLGNGSNDSFSTPQLVLSGVTECLMPECGSNVNPYFIQNWVKRGDEVYVCGFDDANCYTGMGLTENVMSWTPHTILGHGKNKIKHLGALETASGGGRAYVAITEDNRMLVWAYNAQNAITMDNTTRVPVPQDIPLPMLGAA